MLSAVHLWYYGKKGQVISGLKLHTSLAFVLNVKLITKTLLYEFKGGGGG